MREDVCDGLPLKPLARRLTDTGGRQDHIEVEYARLCLGRLRALRYECEQFNDAQRPVDGQRFLEMCSSCGVKVGSRPVHIPGLDELIAALEAESEDLEEQRAEIALGRVQFAAMGEVFLPGARVFATPDGFSGAVVGLTVLQSWYQLQNTLFGPEKTFHVELAYLASMGSAVAWVVFTDNLSAYRGARELSALPYRPLGPDLLEKLRLRGEKYVQAISGVAYVQYPRGAFFPRAQGPARSALLSAGRVLLDTARGLERGYTATRGGDFASNGLQQALRVFKQQQKHGTDALRLVEPRPDEVWMMWPALVGFSFTAKCWGQVLVEDTSPVEFREQAFEQLVLPADRKELIRAAVRHAGNLGGDLVSGKGGSCIFLLHGPPGSGKTLTAEAIAEMLKMPLYVVTAGDLGTTAPEVEQRLSEVLQLCGEWNALTLIDEADIFLETRTTAELQRNSVVCVMLRLLEYHQGVLFLTTNRASNIDPAVRSRITVALRYAALSVEGREAVWGNLAALSGAQGVDCARLARHPLNGRQIKSCLLLATALAAERGEPVSPELLERAVEIVGDVQPEEPTRDELSSLPAVGAPTAPSKLHL